jgi:hypothetical protein
LRLVTLALRTEKIEDLLLVDVHASSITQGLGDANAFG